MKKSVRFITGFLIAPLAPAIVFSIIILIFELFRTGEIVVTIFFSLYWLFFSIPSAYMITFLFGIPAFLVYRKLNLISLRAYLIGSGIVGILAAIVPIFYFGGFDYTGLFIALFGMLSGMLTGSVFWRIVYNTSVPLDW